MSESTWHSKKLFQGKDEDKLTFIKDEVHKMLSYISENKSPGSDKISPKMFKSFAHERSKPILYDL